MKNFEDKIREHFYLIVFLFCFSNVIRILFCSGFHERVIIRSLLYFTSRVNEVVRGKV